MRAAIWIAVTVPIAVSGCRENGFDNDPPPEVYVYPVQGDDWYIDEHVAEVTRTFDHQGAIASKVAASDSVHLYMGLPHEFFEGEAYHQILSERETLEFHGSSFHAAAIELEEGDLEALITLCTRRESFFPYHGPKNCGGYHADWCLVWDDQDCEVIMHFCFGCNEMQATDGSIEMHCDIWADDELKRVFDKYKVGATRRIQSKP